jgi:hypothetical protein
MNHYVSIVLLERGEADEPMRLLREQGPEAAIEYCRQWEQPGGGIAQKCPPWGQTDFCRRSGNYVLSYNPVIGYIGLCRVEAETPLK